MYCVVLGLALLVVAPLAAQADEPNVHIVELDDTVTPIMAQYIEFHDVYIRLVCLGRQWCDYEERQSEDHAEHGHQSRPCESRSMW